MHSPLAVRRILVLSLVLGSVALVGLHDGASDPASTEAIEAPGLAGMRIALDPETGDIIESPVLASSTQKLDDELAQALSRSTEGLVEVRHPDGSVSVDLKGRFQSATVVRIEADGSLSQRCVDSIDGAEHALEGTACTHDAKGLEVQ